MHAEPITHTDQLTIGILPAPEMISMARMFAGAVARHYGCGEDTVEDVKLAVSEATTNSVKAHRDAGVDESIRIVAYPDVDSLWFEVIDRGKGFEPLDVLAGDETPPFGLYEGSLGLTLIRACFPTFEIVRGEGRGMVVRFAVSLGAAEL